MRCPCITAGFGLLFGLLVLPFPVRAQETASSALPFLDRSLSTDQRVDDLIGRMTLEEKVAQMQNSAPAIPRLGVPQYDWWNEGLHGVARAGTATDFPQVIGMAATWDADLVRRMGETVSTEARAKYNEAVRQNDRERYFGLTYWSPNINIFRDPRWGRGQETYGEDPYLTGRLGVAFVKGMQGDDPNFLKAVSTPKHFAVHSGPEPVRHKFDVPVSPHDLEDTYLPAFRATVTEAHAQSVMCAYNAIDGAPACANDLLLKDHLRNAWAFDGYVVSDCDAVSDVALGHHYAADLAHAAAMSVKAGTDLDCGTAYKALVDAVHQGLVTEADLDTALHRMFRARFRLGMFDPAESYAYGRIAMTEDNSAEHRKLSLQAALESIVLLKNAGGALPLRNGLKKIAVVGPTAELVQSLQGNYNAPPPEPVLPVVGLEKRFGAGKIVYAQGSSLVDGFAMPIERTALRPARGKGNGLTGEYFAAEEMAGAPVLTRVDRAINFNWDKAAPVPGMPIDHYAVRWSGEFVPPAAGDYKLGVRINYCYACQNAEAFKLYLDGKLLAENASSERREAVESPVHFSDTAPHAIRLEYVHGAGASGIDLVWEAPAEALRSEAVKAAKKAQVTVAFVGLSPQLEGEEMPVTLDGFSGGDRTAIDLPKAQEAMLEAIATATKGKPLIVVLQNGSALAVNWAQEHASAVLEAWYPGEEAGTAIAETLAGDNNPGGRLPLTFYASLDQVPAFEDYSMQGRTYRYFAGKPLYGFGYGLSYTNFAYSHLSVPSESVEAGKAAVVTVEVRNTGPVAGDEVVELYVTQPPGFETPLRELVGFQRVHAVPTAGARVTFTIDPRSLGQVDEAGNRKILPGEYTVWIGGSQPGDGGAGVSTKFTVVGTADLPK